MPQECPAALAGFRRQGCERLIAIRGNVISSFVYPNRLNAAFSVPSLIGRAVDLTEVKVLAVSGQLLQFAQDRNGLR